MSELKHNWLEIEKQESNPTQTWHRLRDNAIKSIHDLTLLAQKLPEDKQKEIFTPTIVDSLINQILYGWREETLKPDIFNPRRAELAARLVKQGTNLNSDQYQ